MPSSTTIRVTDANGGFLFETADFIDAGDNPGLRYVLSCGLVGALTVTLPPEFNDRLPKDGRIHVMRSVNGGPAQREGESCFLIRKWTFTDNYTTVTALHANHIMWRRCSLWAADTANSQQSGTAANVLANIWDVNFASGVTSGGGARAWDTTAGAGNSTQADISAYVPAAANTFTGLPTVDIFYPWSNVGDAIRDVCNDATLQGTYLTTEIVAPTESTFEWRIYVNQRGQDRTFASGSGLLFTEARGNLANAILTVDATEEITLAEAGGALRNQLDTAAPDYGLSNRVAVDTTRMGESPFGRIEAFVDSGNATDLAMILGDANSGVRAGRPVVTAVGDLQETDTCIRGIDFNYGDVVTVEVRGIQYDMRLDVIEVALQGGVETTKAAFFYAD